MVHSAKFKETTLLPQIAKKGKYLPAFGQETNFYP